MSIVWEGGSLLEGLGRLRLLDRGAERRPGGGNRLPYHARTGTGADHLP